MSSVSFDGRLEIILHCLGDDLEDELQLSLAAYDQVLSLVQIKNLRTGLIKKYRSNLLFKLCVTFLIFPQSMAGFCLTFPQRVASMEGFTIRNFRLLKETQLNNFPVIY